MKAGRVSSCGWLAGYGGFAFRGWEQSSFLYRILRDERAGIGVAPVAQFRRGPSWGQIWSGACRSELSAGVEHVPDRLGEFAREIDLRDTRAALAAEPPAIPLVSVAVNGVPCRVLGGLDQRPAQPLRAVLPQRAAAVGLTGLVSRGHSPV